MRYATGNMSDVTRGIGVLFAGALLLAGFVGYRERRRVKGWLGIFKS